MATILVLGSEGSLMQAVIPLLHKDNTIIGVDNLFRHSHRVGKNYEFFQDDASDRKAMKYIFDIRRPDYVIQAAARIYGVGGFNKYCADILGNDIVLHKNILDLSVEYGVKKVIYISSSMVYETCPQSMDFPVSEYEPDLWPAPRTEYGLSKYVGEKLSEAYLKQHGLDYTIWRPFNIITPHEKALGQDLGISHVFADFMQNIIGEQKNPVPIIGDGNQIRCFTYIDDVAECIATHSLSDRTDNMIFNVGNPEPVTMKDLATRIHNIAVKDSMVVPKPLEFETVAEYPNDVRVRIPNIELAEKYLGFSPKKTLDMSLDICIKHFYRSILKW